MKTLLSLTLLLCTLLLAKAGDIPALKADPAPAIAQHLFKLERAWNEAFKAKDTSALSAFCAEDFLSIDDEGQVSDKAHYLADSMKPTKVLSYALSNMVAHVYGDTAVLTGRWSGKISVEGEESMEAFQFTDTFVRRQGKWWAIASQMTRVAGNR